MPKVAHVRQQQNHMATIFDLAISCEFDEASLAQRILGHCHLTIARLERELSEFHEASPVLRLNRSRIGERVVLTAAGIELLERSKAITSWTVGAFDPMVKGRGKIDWDQSTREAWKLDADAHLGFGAIGKGYALDQIRIEIERAGFSNYVLSGGGSSLILSGFADPIAREPWTWGWSWKRDVDRTSLGIPFVHSGGGAVALGISGTHEQGEHLLDPRAEHKGAAGSLKSALVAHPSATEADALSTALFVSGWEEGSLVLARTPVPPAIAVIDQDETPRWNGIFQRLWGAARTRSLSAVLCAVAFAAAAFPRPSFAEDAVDLSTMDTNTFTPYVLERNPWWVLLPIFTLVVVLSHLRKNRRNRTEGTSR